MVGGREGERVESDGRGGGREGEGAEEARGGDEGDGEAREEHVEEAGEAEEGRGIWVFFTCLENGKWDENSKMAK